MKKWIKKLVYGEKSLFVIMGCFVLLTVGIMVCFTYIFTTKELLPERDKEYSRHYVMIGKNPKDPFWLSIYEAARKRGEEVGAYVENYGENLARDYSVEERLEMIVAAGADRTVDKIHGIIAETDSAMRVKELVDQACDKNMPVITILSDSGDETKRKSFIGINHQELGKSYGTYIQEIINRSKTEKNEQLKNKVWILLDYYEEESYQNATYSAIVDSLRQMDITTGATRVDNNVMFSAEETIRSLVLDPDNRPDILVCLSEDDTIAAQQVVIDLNLVGTVKILGYYDSEEILEGIRKGIIETTAVVDTEELGIAGLNALHTFVDTRYVSEWQLTGNEVYFITRENVDEYLEEMYHGQE